MLGWEKGEAIGVPASKGGNHLTIFWFVHSNTVGVGQENVSLMEEGCLGTERGGGQRGQNGEKKETGRGSRSIPGGEEEDLKTTKEKKKAVVGGNRSQVIGLV